MCHGYGSLNISQEGFQRFRGVNRVRCFPGKSSVGNGNGRVPSEVGGEKWENGNMGKVPANYRKSRRGLYKSDFSGPKKVPSEIPRIKTCKPFITKCTAEFLRWSSEISS